MHIDDIDPKSNSASISAKIVPDADEITSKSTRKKEALALQKLGLQLTQLKPDHLNSLVLPENLLKAIFDHKRFSSREAQRRQLQYIGRLMRELDTESIAQQLATLEGQSAQARHQFHQSEQWRSRLLKDPAALTDFVDTYPKRRRTKTAPVD